MRQTQKDITGPEATCLDKGHHGAEEEFRVRRETAPAGRMMSKEARQKEHLGRPACRWSPCKAPPVWIAFLLLGLRPQEFGSRGLMMSISK